MTAPVTGPIEFFPASELECPTGRVILLDARFATELPALRRAWGAPLKLNSCCRTPAHNLKVKGHPRSLHLTVPYHAGAGGTMAADIAWHAWPMATRRRFVTLALGLGWSVGRANGFVHVDLRTRIGLIQTTYDYAGLAGW